MDQNFHLIEKYFQGKLDQDELQLFNEKLQKDAAFEQEFRDMKLLRDALKETSRIKALHVLQDAEATLAKKETTKISVSMKRLVSIAASLIIVATVSYFAISSGTGALTGEQVFDTYYEPYINLNGRVRGDDMAINTLSARAYNAYDIADYSTSSSLFAELLTKEKSAMNYLYSGISNLEAGNFEDAKNNLNTVMNNFTELKDQAQWYLAMTLFKEGAEDEAVANVASLSLSSGSFSNKAANVLKSLSLKLEDDGDIGEIIVYEEYPNTPPESVPGLEEDLGRRRYQMGDLKSVRDDRVYAYFNEQPIDGLRTGDEVEFVIVRSARKRKGMALILDKR